MTIREDKWPLRLARLCTAIRFLTIVPVSWRAGDDSERFKDCLLYFPVVGALIGAGGLLAAQILLWFFPPQLVAALALIYLGLISGFLHLDGLSDSADGLLSARPREACLRIMKDSRVGAMGVVALVFVLLIKYSALSAMPPQTMCLAVFFMPLAGRCAILFSMARLPYARAEGGLGGLFYSDSSKKAALAALLVLVVLLVVFAPSLLIVTLIAVSATTMIFGRWCRNRLGGATGDTLGAICELTEASTAIAFTAFFS